MGAILTGQKLSPIARITGGRLLTSNASKFLSKKYQIKYDIIYTSDPELDVTDEEELNIYDAILNRKV